MPIDFGPIVEAAQTGQMDSGTVKQLWDRLDDNERSQYMTTLQGWSKGKELHRPDNSFLGLPPEAAAVTGVAGAMKGVAGGATSVLGKVAPGAMEIGKVAIPLFVIEQLPISQSAKTALMVAIGLKGGVGGAGKAATAAEEIAPAAAKAGEVVAPMSDAEYLASTGRARGTLKPASNGPAPTSKVPFENPPNLTQKMPTEAVAAGEGPSGGARGVHVETGFNGHADPPNLQRSGPNPAPPNLSQKTSTGAVRSGQGPSGGARGAQVEQPGPGPSSSGVRLSEHPPGASNKTSPIQWKSMMDNMANEVYNSPAELDRMRQMIQDLLRGGK